LETEHENGKETKTENFSSFPFLFQAYVLLKFHDLSTMLRLYKKYHSNSCPVPVPSKLNTIYRNYYIFYIITHTGPYVLFQFRILILSRPNYRFVLFFFTCCYFVICTIESVTWFNLINFCIWLHDLLKPKFRPYTKSQSRPNPSPSQSCPNSAQV
jgi:hypothetical protein